MEFDNRAELYDNLNWVHEKGYIEKIVKACDPNSEERILDIGTGTGIIANALSKYCRVDGIDQNESMIKLARARTSTSINYKTIDICKPNISELDKYNCVVARMAFHHFEDIKTAMDNIKKISGDNFRLVIAEGIPAEGTSDWYRCMFRYKEDRHVFTLDSLVNLLIEHWYFNISYEIHTSKDMSLNNWLNNSNIDVVGYNRIFSMHLNADEYIKKAYNIRLIDGDIIMDWRSVIIKGTT